MSIVLDTEISFTVWRDRTGTRHSVTHTSLASFARTALRAATAPRKDALPLVKLAVFGDVKSDNGALRHDANLTAITGVELDYDGGLMPIETAAEIMRA